MLRAWLSEPRLADVDVDAPELIALQRKILERKPLTRRVFGEIYEECLRAESRYLTGAGIRVEIGAGSSFLKSMAPDVLATDVKTFAGHDLALDALAMPFPDRSVRTVFAIHTFHHLPDPEAFFRELERVLVPGGGCVLVDPFYGPVARILYKRLFTTEGFDLEQRAWTTVTSGPMAGANQALSGIVFGRDHGRFARDFRSLEVVLQKPLTNWLRYLASGGINFRSVAPSWTEPLLRSVEAVLAPAAPLLALHHLVAVRRRT